MLRASIYKTKKIPPPFSFHLDEGEDEAQVAIKPIRKGLELPVIKRHVQGDKPPAFGEGLRLAIYQGNGLLCGDKKAIQCNLRRLEEHAEKAEAEQAQVLAVAELFLCGCNVRQEDKEEAAVALEEVVALIGGGIAFEHNIAMVVPHAEWVEGDDRMFDSMVLVDNTGNLVVNCRKTQLWGGDEKTAWRCPYVEDPENACKVNKINGIKVGLLNCYEAEFPELNRVLALQGAQVVLIPTAADVGTFDHGC